MAYRTVKEYGGVIVAAGEFPARKVQFISNPVDGNSITIVFNGVSRSYTFSEVGGADISFVSPPTTVCHIGSNIQKTIINLIHTINSTPIDIQVGTDGTITPVLSGSENFIVYGNNKITTGPSIQSTIGGFLGATIEHQAGQLQKGAYPDVNSPNGPYNNSYSAICFGGSGVTNHDLLVLKEVNGDAYNIGPPKSCMHVITIPLQGGVIHEIQTFGSTSPCVLLG
jgi:hypothetical protein